MIFTKIKGAINDVVVKVTERGQLVTAPISYSEFYTAVNATNNVAVNVVPPKTGKRFVITSIILSTDRTVGVNGAVISVYENSIGPTSSTISKLLYRDEIQASNRAVLPQFNGITTEGRWINMVADDTVVRANITGYYVDA